ncbi:alpha/beta hydrolase [Singulisphaera acidiphila]|uniref:Lysophospholipase n=1 Tax=Singulisphaera acidiphila (strain ATCC BAA-1392 / DSM 18658 / VKM B-2454 / MOB10) TaxID=886293 RepID=L0DNT7_SINAD|nr:alpha/beta hydrolase [Singulisphaera acidiphila]AGA30480.1 lysophospholipase [Singulisphaera acidiphila DSM 18658]
MITTQSPPRDVAISTPDGLSLRGWHWTRPNPRGVLVIAHGFGEHGGCYRHVAEALGPALELEILSPDLRGHGRSPGPRGVVKRYEDLISDLHAAVDWARQVQPSLPTYVLGHSNGGQLALRLGLEPDAALDGVIVSNPSLRVATRVALHKLLIGRFLRRFAPAVTLGAKLNATILTSDPDMQREHQVDPLRHSRISAPLFFGMVEGGQLMADRAAEFKIPLLMILGGRDEVVDPEQSRLVFDRIASADKTLRIFPQMLHEPLNELGREQVFADIISWLNPRLDRLSEH